MMNAPSRPLNPECPLRDNRHVLGEGPSNATMAIVGEAPGYEEDRQGRPFMGAAGRELDAQLARVGIKRKDTFITNALCSRPPNNAMDDIDAQQALHCCGIPGLTAELASLKKLRVIIALGNTALTALGLEPGIVKRRGSVYTLEDGPLKDVFVVPTYHPAAVLRNPAWRPITWADLAKAKEISREGWRPYEERFLLGPTLSQVRDFCSALIKEHALLACDIETTALRPSRGEIVCLGLAPDAEHAIVIPFWKQGHLPYWANGDAERVREMLAAVFDACPLMFQNALFDLPWIEHHIGPVKEVQHDVILGHHCVDPESPHNLGFIVSVYGSTPYWKDTFKQREGRILDMDNTELWTYNARDCVVLHQVLPRLLADMDELQTTHIYQDISVPLIRPVAEMTRVGLPFSKSRLKKWREELVASQFSSAEKLFTWGKLPGEPTRWDDPREPKKRPPTFNLDSGEDLRLLIYGVRGKKFGDAAAWMKTFSERDPKKQNKTTAIYKKNKMLLRIAEVQQLAPLERLGRQLKTTDSGSLSTDSQALLRLEMGAANRLLHMKHLIRRTEEHKTEEASLACLRRWLAEFRSYQETTTLLKTFTKDWTQEDGRVHPSFKIHGTCSGRLSSSDPNCLNIPKKGGRLPYVASKGKVWLAADYSNLEVRIAAYQSNDEPLIETFESGASVHDQNAWDLFEMKKGDELFQAARDSSKTFIFGRVLYLGGLPGIHERINAKHPELGLTLAHMRDVDARYRRLHPQLMGWLDRAAQEVATTRKSYTVGGRLRILRGAPHDVVKEGVNHRIQGTAADIINPAMLGLHADKRFQKLNSPIILQLYDALHFEAAKEHLDVLISLVRAYMEKPFLINNVERVFPVDIAVGPSWGELEEIAS